MEIDQSRMHFTPLTHYTKHTTHHIPCACSGAPLYACTLDCPVTSPRGLCGARRSAKKPTPGRSGSPSNTTHTARQRRMGAMRVQKMGSEHHCIGTLHSQYTHTTLHSHYTNTTQKQNSKKLPEFLSKIQKHCLATAKAAATGGNVPLGPLGQRTLALVGQRGTGEQCQQSAHGTCRDDLPVGQETKQRYGLVCGWVVVPCEMC
jgi:hypothetical protein